MSMQPKQAPTPRPDSGPPGLQAGHRHPYNEVQTPEPHPRIVWTPIRVTVGLCAPEVTYGMRSVHKSVILLSLTLFTHSSVPASNLLCTAD